jgi:hypothetical protein
MTLPSIRDRGRNTRAAAALVNTWHAVARAVGTVADCLVDPQPALTVAVARDLGLHEFSPRELARLGLAPGQTRRWPSPTSLASMCWY